MTNRRVVLHCDAGSAVGIGHLMRCSSLAREAADRGWETVIVGEIDPTGIRVAARVSPSARVVTIVADKEDERLDAILRERPDVIHLDTYRSVPESQRTGIVVSNMQDGPFGVRRADIAIDANLGSESAFESPELAAAHLAGIDVAVIRRQVLDQRGAAPAQGDRPRVLVVIGGTDPHALTARVVESLAAVDLVIDVTVVDVAGRADVRAAAAASPHAVEVVGFVDDLPALARHHDLAVTAAGTTVWDFACMGVPMALVCAVDNQMRGYRHMVEAGLAIGLGTPPHDDLSIKVAGLGSVLRDSSGLREERTKLMRKVDGRGAWRVVSAWEQLLEAPPVARDPIITGVTARGATLSDARMLFEWRNDEETRARSRTGQPLEWEAHRGWLEQSVKDPCRLLLVVEDRGEPFATVRWDRADPTSWMVSMTVAPSRRGQGLASSALAAAERALEAPRPHRLLADVHLDNRASLRIFARAGYLPHLPADDRGFTRLARWRFEDLAEVRRDPR